MLTVLIFNKYKSWIRKVYQSLEGREGHSSVHSRRKVTWKEYYKSVNPERVESMESTGLELGE